MVLSNPSPERQRSPLQALAFQWFRVKGRLLRYWGGMCLRASGASLGHRIVAWGAPIISVAPGSSLDIGDDVVLCSSSTYTDLGVYHPVVLRTLRRAAKLTIGSDTGMSGATICAAVSVSIGRRCLFGANVQIVDTDFHSVEPQGRRYSVDEAAIAAAAVTIEDDVFLGANALVLKGVTVGAGAVVGAGSVVTRDVPAGAIVAGNPARVIGRSSPAAAPAV